MKKLIVSLFVGLISISNVPANAAETITIGSSTAYTASIDGVGAIWKGNIPTKITFPAGTYSQKLEFQIQGILPYSVLADRATGTDVEFELWSEQGKKIASDTVYSFDWNPVGPNTLVSMYLSESDAIGTPILIVRTIYEISTTGLLSRYLKSEQRFPVSISTVKKPVSVDITAATYETDGLTWSFSALADPSISSYELGMKFIKAPGLDPTNASNYGEFVSVGQATAPRTYMKFSEAKKILSPYISNFSNSAVGVAVRASNGTMVGDWGKWYYFETKYITAYEEKLASELARAESEKADRINRCNTINRGILDLGNLVDAYALKYPSNLSFPYIKAQLPSPLDCSNAASVEMASIISARDSVLANVDVQLKNAMAIADKPLVVAPKKLTITCVKGKVSKKVTGVSPKCPAGYRRSL